MSLRSDAVDVVFSPSCLPRGTPTVPQKGHLRYYTAEIEHKFAWHDSWIREGVGDVPRLVRGCRRRGHSEGSVMNAQLRRRLEMAARCRDFLRAHQMDGVGQDLGLTKLEQLLEQAENLVTQQRTGTAVERAATKQRRDLRRALQPRILGYLSAVGAIAASQNAELAEQFRMPAPNTTHQGLLTMSRAILEKATAQKDLLVKLGMSESVLDELATALGQYEDTLQATSAGRREHVGAKADLKAVAADITKQLRLLDKVVRYRLGDNPELMGAWESARNVNGPLHTTNEPQAPAGETQAPKAA